MVWHTGQSEGRSSSWSSSRPGTLGNFWNMQLCVVWADTQTESKYKNVVRQLITATMKQKEKVVILWCQPGGKMSFCTTVSVLGQIWQLHCIYFHHPIVYTQSPPGEVSCILFLEPHCKSTSKTFEKLPETNKTLQDPEVFKQQANKKTLLLQSTSITDQYFSTLSVILIVVLLLNTYFHVQKGALPKVHLRQLKNPSAQQVLT